VSSSFLYYKYKAKKRRNQKKRLGFTPEAKILGLKKKVDVEQEDFLEVLVTHFSLTSIKICLFLNCV